VRSVTSVGSHPSTISPPTPAPCRWSLGGQVVRHRLSRAGDRKPDHAPDMVTMVQVRRPSAGQAS
jgi:hypothetical protein